MQIEVMFFALLVAGVGFYLTTPAVRVRHYVLFFNLTKEESRRRVERPWFLAGLLCARVLILGSMVTVVIASTDDGRRYQFPLFIGTVFLASIVGVADYVRRVKVRN